MIGLVRPSRTRRYPWSRGLARLGLIPPAMWLGSTWTPGWRDPGVATLRRRCSTPAGFQPNAYVQPSGLAIPTFAGCVSTDLRTTGRHRRLALTASPGTGPTVHIRRFLSWQISYDSDACHGTLPTSRASNYPRWKHATSRSSTRLVHCPSKKSTYWGACTHQILYARVGLFGASRRHVAPKERQ